MKLHTEIRAYVRNGATIEEAAKRFGVKKSRVEMAAKAREPDTGTYPVTLPKAPWETPNDRP